MDKVAIVYLLTMQKYIYKKSLATIFTFKIPFCSSSHKNFTLRIIYITATVQKKNGSNNLQWFDPKEQL